MTLTSAFFLSSLFFSVARKQTFVEKLLSLNRDEAMAASSCYSADLHRMKMEQFCFYFHLDLSSAFFFFQTAGAVR